jgi:hypothetical protein
MAIYRPPKPRWPAVLVAAVTGLLIGIVIGWLAFGRAEPDPQESLDRMRVAFNDAATTLEIVAIEYSESVDGPEVVNRSEYEGAVQALARSRTKYQEFRAAIAMVDQQSTQRIDSAYEELDRLVGEPASPEVVETKINELAALLQALVDGGS